MERAQIIKKLIRLGKCSKDQTHLMLMMRRQGNITQFFQIKARLCMEECLYFS